MTATRQTMPAADAAWLHMDRSTNPLVVNGLYLMGGTPDFELTARLLDERLVSRFPRFRQRVVDPLGRTPAFEDDPAFDLADHLHRVALPAPGDRAALEELVGDLVTSTLDPAKPLWNAYVIEGYEGGAAILWRIHHCIADGIALGRVMLSATDEPEEDVVAGGTARHGETGLRRVAALPGRAAGAIRGAGGAVAHEAMETLAHPAHMRELAGAARRELSTATKLMTSPADAASALRGELTGRRRVAWSDPFPLARIRDAAHRRHVTVNDLLLSVLAAALRAHLGADDSIEELHAMIPVNLRPLDQPVPTELGNAFALILLTLPLGDVPPPERLRQVASRMEEIKRSREAPMSFGLISAIGLTPPWVESRVIDFFTEKASLVVTNVPGPARRLAFAGVPITGILVWAPCSGSLGMTVSIFSYDGEVSVGFMADTGALGDPRAIADAYARELAVYCPA